MKSSLDAKAILDIINSGIIATDDKGNITYFNHRSETKFKLDSKKTVGSHISKILPFIYPLINTCLKSGDSSSGQKVLLSNEHILVDIHPLRSNNKITGVVCNFLQPNTLEFSARKSKSYQQLNRELTTIISASSDGIWVCDGKGVVVTINAASEALNGIQAKEVIGKNISKLLKDENFDQSVTTKVLSSGRQETLIQRAQKTKRLLLCTGTPARDEEGNIVLIVVNERDMTELDRLRNKYENNQRLTKRFKEEITELSLRELDHNTIIADSSKMKHILQKSQKLANIGASNILIMGDSGTGKGLLAKFIHKNSNRKANPFIEINCAALPENLLEAELFGYEKGAFTGAAEGGKIGLFELAQGGTLFLDEIGDMPINLQTKLLKYLDDKEFRRLGGTKPIKAECATVSATNRNLSTHVKNKLFREDLFYRLNSFTLEIPSLSERSDDIPGLVKFYLEKYNRKYDRKRQVSPQMLENFKSYSFPGNTRELKHIVENAVALGDDLLIDDFINTTTSMRAISSKSPQPPPPAPDAMDFNAAIQDYEKQLFTYSKKHCNTTREIAKFLNISQATVVRKLKRYSL